MTDADARRHALAALGGVAQTTARWHDVRSIRWIEDGWHDVRYGVRALRRTPAFAVVAIVTLALGVGANTAIFSVVDRILIRPLPYADPERLAMVWEDATAAGFPRNTPAPGNYTEWTRTNRVFDGIAATANGSANLTGDTTPEQLNGRRVTANFFAVLGVQPIIGRTFSESEDRDGAQVIVISHGLWLRRFGGDPSIVGREVRLNGAGCRILGVMPRSFVFRRNDVDYWAPIHFTPAQAVQRRSHYLNVVARLKPGVTIATADADMRRVSALLQQQYPDSNARVTTVVVPLKDDLLGNTRIELIALMVAAGAVLMIACANLASLLLSRATSRRQDLAVRTALGATRERLVRQLLAEGVTLSATGGTLGLVLAPSGVALLARLAPAGVPLVAGSILDLRLLTFALVASIAAGAVFSILPALQSTRLGSRAAAERGVRTTAGVEARRTRDALVVFQVAAALVLLVAAGLLLRTVGRLRSIELGFTPEHVLTLRTPLPPTRYRELTPRLAFYNSVLAQVRALPGVENAAYGSVLPFTNSGNTSWFEIEGATAAPDPDPDALRRVGTDGYLQTLGAQVIDGRLLDDRDVAGAPLSAVVNETMARRYLPNVTAVGHRIHFGPGPQSPTFNIVGVVKDLRERGYALAMKPAVYLSVAQLGNADAADTLIVRASSGVAKLANPIRRIVAGVDPDQPIAAIRPLADFLDLDIADRQQHMVLLSTFAGLALFLAAIGLYGVLSYVVAQRTREIGVRLALGASRQSVLRMVLGYGLRLTAIGLAIGLVLSFAASRLLAALLVGISSTDPMTLGGVVATIAAVALVACYLPSHAATRVDPVVALRSE
jgi:predicted permease